MFEINDIVFHKEKKQFVQVISKINKKYLINDFHFDKKCFIEEDDICHDSFKNNKPEIYVYGLTGKILSPCLPGCCFIVKSGNYLLHVFKYEIKNQIEII